MRHPIPLNSISPVVRGYLDMMMELGVDEDQTANYFDISLDAMDHVHKVCGSFVAANQDEVDVLLESGMEYGLESLGADLYLVSAGHGTGFTDRGFQDEAREAAKAVDAAASRLSSPESYLGDDGLLYIAGTENAMTVHDKARLMMIHARSDEMAEFYNGTGGGGFRISHHAYTRESLAGTTHLCETVAMSDENGYAVAEYNFQDGDLEHEEYFGEGMHLSETFFDAIEKASPQRAVEPSSDLGM